MNRKRRNAVVLAIVLANTACAETPTSPAFDPDPMLHPPGGRIVFNRMCADEDPYRVKAYARMESQDGRARAVADSTQRRNHSSVLDRNRHGVSRTVKRRSS